MQHSGIETFDLPNDVYYKVKQRWLISGKVDNSSYFVWKPKVYIMYYYFITPQTLRFIRYKD